MRSSTIHDYAAPRGSETIGHGESAHANWAAKLLGSVV
jgi:hypothetical protein